ncbi:hypothetical protein JCM8097_004566 [Rhodosporidiobolus ruineniae]
MSYTPLPSSLPPGGESLNTAPLAHDLEKAPLSLSLADTDNEQGELRLGGHSYDQDSHPAARRAKKLAVVVGATGLLFLGGAVTSALFCDPGAVSKAWDKLTACGTRSARAAVEGTAQADGREGGGGGSWRWWKRALGDTELSTSTHTRGGTLWTSTYVRTTRPIVNPGGFTIGTLTGFVPTNISSTASNAAPTNSSSSSATSATAASSASGSDSGETTSTQFYAAPTDSSSSSSAESGEAAATTTTTATVTETVLSTTTSTETETTTAAPSPPSARRAKRALEDAVGEEWDFGPQVEAHLLHRRGEDFERAAEGAEEEESEDEGKEEFSTSTNRKGSVATLVKTTRPILNPAGFTVGTLSGAWVDVAKQTDRSSSLSTIPSSASPTPTAPSSVSSGVAAQPTGEEAKEREKRRHEELRRRAEQEQ